MSLKPFAHTALSSVLLSTVCMPFAPALAEGANDGIEHISVIGTREVRALIPGGATYIGEEDLEAFEHFDMHRILYQVPGVQIMEEDGFGLRPNIGIRGSGSERSERVNLMEDGVLIAPAPYAAPGAYYFPTAGRLSAVEVRKGSSAVKFGPRSTAGAINMISTTIPDEDQAYVMSRMGDHGLREAHMWAGGSRGGLSALAEVFISSADGFKDLPNGENTGYELEDYMGKVRWTSGPQSVYPQSIELKLSHTSQMSNETYLGLTQDDYDTGPYQRYAASARDQFNSTHKQVMLSHHIDLQADMYMTNVVYENRFQRDWYKLDDLDFGDGRGRIRPSALFADPSNPLNVAGLNVLRGASSVDDALQLRHNARAYVSRGAQTVVTWTTGEHSLELGARLHEDEEDRLQARDGYRMDDGAMVLTSLGAEGSQANRLSTGKALAVFVEDTWSKGAWTFIPGLRMESVSLKRYDYATSDPERLDGATRIRQNKLTVFTPGLGVLYDVNDHMRLIAGLYRGYAPPAPGSTQSDAEKSTNLEAGVRYEAGSTQLDVILFQNAYSNLLGTCTNSTGCEGGDVGDQYNAGRVRVRGLETSLRADVGHVGGVSFPLAVAYTFTDGSFRTSFANGFFGTVTAGDHLPYSARHSLNVSLGMTAVNWDAALKAHHQSAVYDGAGGDKIAARTIADLAINYRFKGGFSAFVTIENALNNNYVAAGRPYGLRPGKPRSINLGIRLKIGGV